MREAITDTIRDHLKLNATWTNAAKALYDGYEHGSVVRPQQLPKYLSVVRYATQGSPEALAEARKVFYNIERLSKNGAPTKSLRAAYSSLVRAAQTGTEEQLEKACYVAVQEKSRYVAQRIIRTELSRAYLDGFNAKIMQDDDVVAVRLRLSSRHPVFDICDLFAETDMYGLSKGVYPKDNPLHPYCMCRLEEVFKWEVDISKQKTTSSRRAISGSREYPTRTDGSSSASKEMRCGRTARTGRSICGTGRDLQSQRRGAKMSYRNTDL